MIEVTVTGADDGVGTLSLKRMSEHYPWVEWGILLSGSRAGTPRYPSLGWLGDLARQGGMRLSAHLCGSLVREPAHGALAVALGGFSRVQVNGYEIGTASAWAKLFRDPVTVRTRLILQANSWNNLAIVQHDAKPVGADVLFDPSGGRGIPVTRWPSMPSPSVRLGFAGGIRRENVESVLKNILSTGARDFWIDLESGVRTDDRFDWNRVVSVLDKVQAINERLR